MDALMCARSVGLDNAPYVEVLRHVRLLTISAHNDEGNWVKPSPLGSERTRSFPVAEAAQQIRYNFGTTGGEISGERACKRRSAKHLQFVPSLLEGRCSVQLSYGRAANPDSKAFTVRMNTVLDGLTICHKGRRSI